MLWAEILELVLLLLLLGVMIAAGWWVASRGMPLVERHARSLATRDDLNAVGQQMQVLARRISAQEETIRHQMASRPSLDPIRFEKEVEILSTLWQALLEMQNAALELALMNPGEEIQAAETTPRLEAGLRKLANSYNALSVVIHQHRPFFPADIFDDLVKLMTMVTQDDTSTVPGRLQAGSIGHEEAFWLQAIGKTGAIVEAIDEICAHIRLHVTTSPQQNERGVQ